MGLRINRPSLGKSKRLIVTLMAVFALVVQPGYGLVRSQIASATSGSVRQPFSVESVCQDEKVVLELIANQNEMPNIPQGARNWHAVVNYRAGEYGRKTQDLSNGDIDRWTAPTGKYSIDNVAVSAHVIGGYTVLEDIIIWGHKVGSWDKPYVYSETFTVGDISKKCDTSGPEVSITTPELNSVHNSDVDVKVEVTDSGSGLDFIHVNVGSPDGKSFGCTQASRLNGIDRKETSCSVRLSGRDSGEYHVRVRAGDMVSNTTMSTDRKFVIDTNKPVHSISSHKSGDLVSGEITLEGTASNEHSIVEGVTVQVNKVTEVGGNFVAVEQSRTAASYNSTTGRWDLDVDTGSFSGDGVYRFVVNSVDSAGNERYSPSIDLRVDNTSPDASIEAPEVTNSSNPTIRGIASDAHDIGQHWFEVIDPNGDYFYVSGKSEFSLSEARDNTSDKNPIIVIDGEYRIRYVATDKAGNRSDNPGHSNPTLHYMTIDRLEPKVEVSEYTSTLNSITVAGTSSGQYPVEVRLGGRSMTVVPSQNEDGVWVWSVSFTGLKSDMAYAVTVSSTDSVGNPFFMESIARTATPFLETNSSNDNDDDLPIDEVGGDTIGNFDPLVSVSSPSVRAQIQQASTDDSEVLGSRDVASAADSRSILGAADVVDEGNIAGGKLLGLAWYWWVVILATIGAAAWMIATAVRNRREDAELGF